MTELVQWVIYRHPADAPTKYVVRKWLIKPGEVCPTQISYQSENLEEARAHIPPGMFCLGRTTSDEPQIVEVWT